MCVCVCVCVCLRACVARACRCVCRVGLGGCRRACAGSARVPCDPASLPYPLPPHPPTPSMPSNYALPDPLLIAGEQCPPDPKREAPRRRRAPQLAALAALGAALQARCFAAAPGECLSVHTPPCHPPPQGLSSSPSQPPTQPRPASPGFGWSYAIARTMFETDKIPQFFVPRWGRGWWGGCWGRQGVKMWGWGVGRGRCVRRTQTHSWCPGGGAVAGWCPVFESHGVVVVHADGVPRLVVAGPVGEESCVADCSSSDVEASQPRALGPRAAHPCTPPPGQVQRDARGVGAQRVAEADVCRLWRGGGQNPRRARRGQHYGAQGYILEGPGGHTRTANTRTHTCTPAHCTHAHE